MRIFMMLAAVAVLAECGVASPPKTIAIAIAKPVQVLTPSSPSAT